MSSAKGQLLTTDFVLSLAIFLAMLITVATIWSSVDTQVKDSESRRDMQALAIYVSDTLMRSRGHPENWNNETVQVIGLASDEHVIDVYKFLAFKHMAESDYDRVRSLLRVGNYNISVWLTGGEGYELTSGVARSPVAVLAHVPSGLDYANMLNGSPLEWDLYHDTLSGLDVATVEDYRFTKRYRYNFNNQIDAFNKLMDNQSHYRTIIIEDISLANTTAGLNNSGLQEFVDRGGLLIFTDGLANANTPLIGGYLNMSFAADSSNPAVFVQEPLLRNVSKGDVIKFSTAKRGAYSNIATGDSDLHVVANSSATSCKICWWGYGRGRVYYLDDTSGLVGTEQLYDHLNIVGEHLRLGVAPEGHRNLISVRRMGILDGFDREIINLNIVLWR